MMTGTMKNKNGNIKCIFSKMRTDTTDNNFNYVDYVLTFDFCDIREKNAIFCCLKDAWKWAHPPVESED